MVARCLALSAAWDSGPALALALAVVAAAAACHSFGRTHIAPVAALACALTPAAGVAVAVAAVHIRPAGRCSSHRPSPAGHVRAGRSPADRSRNRSTAGRSGRRSPRTAAGPAAHTPGRGIAVAVAAAVAAVAERRTAAGMPWRCGALSSIVYRIEQSHALWARLSSSCGSRPLNRGRMRPLNRSLDAAALDVVLETKAR
jgi:hypothetical protein